MISEHGIMDTIKTQLLVKQVTLASNTFTAVTVGTLNIPSGYTLLGIVGKTNGYGDQWLVSYSEYAGNVIAMCYSKYAGGSLTESLRCNAIYIKD